jgi:hypothetical protein
MFLGHLAKEVIQEEFRQSVRCEDKIEKIVSGIISRLEYKRQAIVLTFLTDQMYEAMKRIMPNLDYTTANLLYVSAIKQYNSDIQAENPAYTNAIKQYSLALESARSSKKIDV